MSVTHVPSHRAVADVPEKKAWEHVNGGNTQYVKGGKTYVQGLRV